MRARAVIRVVRPEAVLSHHSAAYELGLPAPVDPTVHIMVPSVDLRVRRVGVTCHVGSTDGALWRGGFPVCAPARLPLDMAMYLDDLGLVQLIDALIAARLRPPLGTIASIEANMTAQPGARGIRRLRTAVSRARELVDSPKETELRLLLVDAGFIEPVVNHPVVDAAGWARFWIDLAYPDLLIGIEYQGDHHRAQRETWLADMARTEELRSLGWRLIFVTQADLDDPRDLFRHLREAVQLRKGRPPSRLTHRVAR